MMDFAKIYRDKEIGQILVKIDANDEEKPEVRFYFQPSEDLGICSFAITYKSWESADAYFESIDEVMAVEVVSNVINDLTKAMTEGGAE